MDTLECNSGYQGHYPDQVDWVVGKLTLKVIQDIGSS